MRISRIKKNSLQILLCMPLLTGCVQRLSGEEYLKWVKAEENGLQRIKRIGAYTIRCQYKPTDFVILTEKKRNEQLNRTSVEQKRKELEGVQYFDLFVSNANGDLLKSESTSEADFYNRMYYYSFGFEHDIKLVEGKDTLDCSLYHFERDYDLAKEKRFLLGFESNPKETIEDKTLLIDSKVLGMAIVKIQIKKENLENIPEVDYETKN